MKNLKSLFLALAVAAMPFAFTSCNPAEFGAATITFDAGATIDIQPGADFAITGTVRITEDGARIDDITARVLYVAENGNTVTRVIANSNDRGDNTFTSVTNAHYTFRFDQTHDLADFIGRENLRLEIVANVRNGDQSSRYLTITSIPPTTPLGAAQNFEWRRAGGAATGLAEFGLAWTSNAGAASPFFAIVRKADANGAQRFVQLATNSWTSITTREALADAVNAADDMVDFRSIRADGTHTYDIVLAVKTAGGEYIMLRITNSSSTIGEGGTTISTVNGQSRR